MHTATQPKRHSRGASPNPQNTKGLRSQREVTSSGAPFEASNSNTSLDRRRKRKLQDVPDGASLPKKQRPDELSEANLRLWEEMSSTSSSRPGIKRCSSKRSMSDITQETTGTRSTGTTAAAYRFTHLATAQLYIHADPPEFIQVAIDAIINAEATKERQDQLKRISQTFHEGCMEAARAAVGEDDFVHLFYTALKEISPNNICLREKADWQEDLKPKPQRSRVNLDFLTDSIFVNGDGPSVPPGKRRQQSVDQAYISPNSSMANATPTNGLQESGVMPPPVCYPSEGDRSPIRTPRPDISIGPSSKTLFSSLSSKILNNTEVKLFLTQLQTQMVVREARGEPALISAPAPRASDLVFPFAVVEGKAYSTGRQIFEAENQAAVSGACALKIQLCLDELVEKRVTPTTSNATVFPDNKPPLFFSFCTEGPLHELWVHWTFQEDGMRKFNMKLLKVCHGVLLKDVEQFIITVDNVLQWGTSSFAMSVAERLGKVAGT